MSLFEIIGDEMDGHFGVGLGSKVVIAVLKELVLECLVIFDDAVMDERQFSAGVEMRVSILIGRLSMRGPASVTDAVRSGGRLFRHQLSEFRDSPGAFARFDVLPINDRDAGGIVAAIFEAAQTIEQDGSCLRTSDVSNNATHVEEERDIKL